MPTIDLPLVKGSGVSKNAKYIDRRTVNLYTIPRDTGNDSYYLRSFPGLTQSNIAKGISYAVEYNDVKQKEYRLIGSELYEDGVSVQGDLSPQLANTCHTASNQAFVSGGKINYWKEGKLYELENWKEGENFVNYPDFKFIAKFVQKSRVTIPEFLPKGDFYLTADMDTNKLSSDSTILFGSGKPADSDKLCKYELKLDRSTGKIIENKIVDGVGSLREVTDYVYGGFQLNALLNNAVTVDGEEFYIPITSIGSEDGVSGGVFGFIEEIRFTSASGGSSKQGYSFIKKVPQPEGEKPETPTDRKVVNIFNEEQFAELDDSIVWEDYKEQDEPTKSDPTSYELDKFIDVDRFGSRFVGLTKGNFIATAISIGANGDKDTDFEHRPDFAGGLIVQRSDPDENMAIRAYQGKYVAVFGRNTVEYFVLSGDVNSVFSPVPNLTTPAGIVATGAVCHFMGVFAGIGSTKGGSLQVMLFQQGSHKPISTEDIDRVLMNYKESELKDVLVESFLREGRQFLVIHLPNETLLYDGSTGNWSDLSTGYGDGRGAYQGRHFIYNPKLGFTCHAGGSISTLDDSISSQNGEIQEFIAYTPMIEAVKGRGMTPIFGLAFETIPGHVNRIQVANIGASFDGYSYTDHIRYEYNKPQEYVNKVVVDSLGAVQHNIAFRLSVMSDEPVALSSFSVRIGQ